jgi:hypothetical protein
MKLNFGQIRDQLQQLLPAMYIMELYDDHAICEGEAGKYVQASYSVMDGKVALGAQVEVQRQYTPVKVQAAVKISGPVGDKTDPNYGYKWRVQVIAYGLGKDGRINWPREPLVAALPLFDNSRVFMLSESQHQDPAKAAAFGKSPNDLVGWLSNANDTGTGIEADFDILTSATKLRSDLLDSFERGNPNFLGLSVDIDALTTTKLVAGKKVKEPVKIVGVQTDIVYDPTNEGKFLKLLAAVQGDDQEKEDGMYNRLLAALRQQRPDLAGKIDVLLAKGEDVTDGDITTLLAAAMPGQAVDVEKLVAALKDGKDSGLSEMTALDDAKKVLEQARLVACSTTLSIELSGSRLPDAVKDKLTAAYSGRVFEVEELKAAIKNEKETLDKLSAAGLFLGAGGSRIEVQGEPERLQAAMDKTFGVATADQYAEVPRFDGLRAAYVRITGDVDVSGYLRPDRLRAATFDTTTFASALGNTLYRRILQDYREQSDFGLSLLVSTKRNAKDFRTLQSINVGYYGDLPTVASDGPYTDLSTITEEAISYAVLKKGGYIAITREMIINDDITMVNRIVSRLPRAARRTLAKICWTLLISNATYDGDSKAMFHADHKNLGSDALGIDSLKAAKLAMASQSDPNGNERLGLRPAVLVIPSDLWGDATDINQTRGIPGTNNQGNAFFNFFGAGNERIFENPFMTDANDWMLLGNTLDAEIVELAFLNGKEEPEMFVADNPAVGAVFTNDRIEYKIRHEYNAEVADYRNAYKAIVA